MIRVPGGRTKPPSEIVGPFLADVVSVLSGGRTGNTRAQLVGTSLARSRTELLISIGRSPVLYVFAATIGVLAYGFVDEFLRSLRPFSLVDRIVLGVSLVVPLLALIALFGNSLRRELAAKTEKEQQAVQERVLVQQVAEEEEPKLRARLELARIALRSRARSMRGDADRLWQRSVWAYRGAFGFFLLAIAGPGVAAALLLKSANPDWHFMFGGLSLAAVPLGIGTALLRHDTKLREQYQRAAHDVASLERYELALDYARIASPETYQATMQQVIAQLLLSRTAPLASPGVIAAGGEHGESEGGLRVQKLLDATVEKAGEVVAAIVPKKSS